MNEVYRVVVSPGFNGLRHEVIAEGVNLCDLPLAEVPADMIPVRDGSLSSYIKFDIRKRASAEKPPRKFSLQQQRGTKWREVACFEIKLKVKRPQPRVHVLDPW